MVAEKYYKVDDIAPMLKFLSEDTTCPIHIAAELDQIVECLPVVEAVEVVYATWENVTGGMVMLGDCSKCSVRQPVVGTNYCKNCGALMKQ